MTPAKEPVVYSNIASAIMAILGALVALNVINVLPEQMQAVETAIGAILLIVGPLLATVLARKSSTPLVAPRDEDGKPLIRADGTTPHAQERAMLR